MVKLKVNTVVEIRQYRTYEIDITELDEIDPITKEKYSQDQILDKIAKVDEHVTDEWVDDESITSIEKLD